MSRLDEDRQHELETPRYEYAISEVRKLGYEIVEERKPTMFAFTFKGSTVLYYPYSGWHTGKTIQDGRGFQNLFKQIFV